MPWFPGLVLRHAGGRAPLRQVRSRTRFRSPGSTRSASDSFPPTALKMMRQVAKPRERWRYDLRAVCTGGGRWARNCWTGARSTFGTTISEGYGQTEMNLMLLNSPDWFEVRPARCGRACPGAQGRHCRRQRRPASCRPARNRSPAGATIPSSCWSTGAIPEATAPKFAGDWLLTGDLSPHRRGRAISSSRAATTTSSSSGGYRIGPGEIEECLIGHPPSPWSGSSAFPVRCAPRSSGLRPAPTEMAPTEGSEGRPRQLR